MSKLAYSILVATMALAACGDDTSSGGGSGGNGTGGDVSEGGNGTGGMVSVDGFCALGCEMPIDCCPAGAVDCPSDAYPNNWTCDDGLCNFGGCADDAECTFGGALPDYICLSTGACAEGCAADADCTAGTTCIGDDGGTSYCTVETTEPEPCTSDDDCFGYGVCDLDSGLCGCEADADCTADGTVCAL